MIYEGKENIPYGYCHCGCGGKTRISTTSSTEKGWVRGEPRRFINGHNKGHYNGGKNTGGNYIRILCKGHPRADGHGYVHEQILVVEKAIGKYLPEGSEIHHVDGNRHNNAPSNLVLCQDRAYHMMLHQRQRAYEASGHANWRKCHICKEYDTPDKLYVKGSMAAHRSCMTARTRAYREVGVKIWTIKEL